MKINHFGPTGFNPYKKNTNLQGGMKASSAGGQDKIEISTQAKELQQTSSLIAEREEKVEALRISIENGTYSLNAQATAKGILDFYKK